MHKSMRVGLRAGVAGLLAVVVFTSLLPVASSSADVQPAVDLGTAGSYSVLASSAVTNDGRSTLPGNVGVSPGFAITGIATAIVGGTVHNHDAQADQAHADLVAAYNATAARTSTTTIAGDLAGRTITPGVYRAGAALAMTTTLTFDALGDPDAIFIFQINAALNTTASSTMRLVNGAKASNIYWQALGAVTLGASSQFVGTMIGGAAITLGAFARVDGRALTIGGAVTLSTNALTGIPPVAAPEITLTMSAFPLSVLAAGDVVTYTFVVTNTGNVTLTLVEVVDLHPGLSTISYAWPGVAGVLAPGDAVTATATYTTTASDVTAGSIANIATASGTPAAGAAVTATALELVPVHPDPLADVITVVQGASVSFNVLANDAAAATGAAFSRAQLDPDPKLIGAATGPGPAAPNYGGVSCVDTGADTGLCTYRSVDSYEGTDGFDYALAQAHRKWNVHVTITVTAENHAPVARNDRLVATAGGPDVSFSPLANDADPDSDTLTITAATTPPAGQGVVTCSAALCTYSPPAAGFTGATAVTYSVSDRSVGASDALPGSATITIFVDPAALAPKGFSASDDTGSTVSTGDWAETTTVTAPPAVCTSGRPSTTISWLARPGATSWIVERRLAGATPGAWVRIASLTGSSTEFLDDRVGEGRNYQWQVRPDLQRWTGSFSAPSAASLQPPAVNANGC